MRMQHDRRLRTQPVDRRMDPDPRVGRRATDRCAVDADDRQARRRDLGEVQPERIDQEPIVGAGDQHREMVRDPFVEVELHRDPEGRGQLDACLALVLRRVHRDLLAG